MVASEIWRIAVLVDVKLTGASALICALCGGMFVSCGQNIIHLLEQEEWPWGTLCICAIE